MQQEVYRWSSIVAPTISQDGLSVWYGGRKSTVFEWRSVSAHRAKWKSTVDIHPVDETAAIPSSPIVTSDGTKLYVVSASRSIACLDTDNGKVLWEDERYSTSLGKTRLTSDDDFVYSVEVRQ